MIANCTASPAVSHPSVFSTPARPRLELRAVIEDLGAVYAAVKFGPSSRLLVVEPGDLESFSAFSRLLAAEGIDARPPVRSWKFAVESAVRRGAAA